MKILPKVTQNDLQIGLFYVGAIRPPENIRDGGPDRDEVHFFGPVGGLQVTYGGLRDPADGEPYGWYDRERELWIIDRPAGDGGRWVYSDVFLTWVTPAGDEREHLRAHCLALSHNLALAEQTMQNMAASGPDLPGDIQAYLHLYRRQKASIAVPQQSNDLAIADAIGDLLSCKQQCLCDGCRADVERVLALALGIEETENDNGR